MTDDDKPRGALADEDAAFLRHVRFGELPHRVEPDERVELQETDARPDLPSPAGDPREWALRWGSGG